MRKNVLVIVPIGLDENSPMVYELPNYFDEAVVAAKEEFEHDVEIERVESPRGIDEFKTI